MMEKNEEKMRMIVGLKWFQAKINNNKRKRELFPLLLFLVILHHLNCIQSKQMSYNPFSIERKWCTHRSKATPAIKNLQ